MRGAKIGRSGGKDPDGLAMFCSTSAKEKDKRKRGRSKRMFMDVIREDGVAEEVAKDRINWKMMILCGDS